jgi:hypothetical protein
MILASPPSYVLAANFRSSAIGIVASLLPPDDATLQNLLNAATARVNGILRRQMLAREETRYYEGDGSQYLALDQTPLIYIRQIAFAQPGLGGLIIPTQNILVDYANGQLITYTPLLLQGAGFVAHFPRGVQLAVRVAWGYGYPIPPPPYTALDTQPTNALSLAPGQYQVAVTSATFWGESTATPQLVTTAQGAINVTVTPVMGAERYRIYAGAAGVAASELTLVGEIPATSFQSQQLSLAVSQIATPADMFPETLPQTDTTAQAIPEAIVEATNLITSDLLLEANNPANAGLIKDNLSQFETTTSPSARSIASPNWMRAAALLEPYSYRDIL